jgi:hypothetical protein
MQTFYFHGTEINAELISRHVGTFLRLLYRLSIDNSKIRRPVGGFQILATLGNTWQQFIGFTLSGTDSRQCFVTLFAILN